MEIHCPSPFPRKLKTVDGPARLMSFPCNEFVPRRQLTRNYSEIIYTIGNCVADYCVNNIKFRSYILRLELFHSLPFAFQLARRVVLRNMELFIGQVTPFIAPYNFHSFNDQDSKSTIQYLRLNFLRLLKK